MSDMQQSAPAPSPAAEKNPVAAETPMPRLDAPSPVPAGAGVAICLLLAVGQVAFAGYQLGGGNQPIQVAFLERWADPTLFAHDEMLRRTMPLYPTYFFRLLAPLLHVSGLEPLYLMLQVLTSFFTLSAVYFLGRSIFRSHAAAIVAAALLVAGHHRALAGEWLYTAWFTHTLAALPLALVALALAYRGRMVWAFVVAGILFNLHALTAAYAMLMIGVALLADVRALGRKRWMLRVLACAGVAIACAAPTLLQMLAARGQVFDAAWINLMRVRSADHSFPTTWWAAPNPDIPRYALIFALFVLSWSFSPVRRRDTARALNVTVLMTIAVAVLFAAGYVFSEIWPTPLIIRLQPFRASRLLLVLMLVHIAYGAVEAIRAGIAGRVRVPAEGAESWQPMTLAARIAEGLTGVLVLLTLGVPTFLPLLPLTVLAVVIAALVSGRLSITQTLVAVASLVVAVLAWRQIHFAIPLLSDELSLWPRQWSHDAIVLTMFIGAIVAAITVALLRRLFLQQVVIGIMLILASWGSWQLFQREGRPGSAESDMPLARISAWARSKTPKDAVFLAPTNNSAFRMLAERALVGDWRDGTQLYFSAAYGPEWLSRLMAVEPGLLLSPDGTRLVARGRPLDSLDDEELMALARKFDASYILLPTPPKTHPRTLQPVYSDERYTAYLPKLAPDEAALPPGVINPAEWRAMEKFLNTTVAQNIEKNRKADVTIQIVDPTGRPVQDLPVTLDQKSHAFLVGCSLSFFEPNNQDPLGDQKGPPVTDAELKLFPTAFNASMIPFSGKWMYIEPEEGQRHWSDLDKYLAYCQEHNTAVEYHFLTGLLPKFLRGKHVPGLAEKMQEHAREVVARYHDKVRFWQVFNSRQMMRDTPPLFKEFREKYPGIKLGISECMRFYSDKKDPRQREREMYNGIDSVEWLKSQGVTPDFLSMHGHYPIGLWADPRTMYETFDRIQKEGVKVHVSEMFLPLNSDIVGPVRKGKWTPEIQAEYYQRFFAVCFSHPDVEMVNLWGMVHGGWGGSAGLLDEQHNPRPAFDMIRKLFHETWHTKVQTQLALDGTLATRAFHGGYQLTVKLPNGREATTTLKVPEQSSINLKFVLNPATATLTPQ
jgi:GH35 family endo-1,4-beta-xylanase